MKTPGIVVALLATFAWADLAIAANVSAVADIVDPDGGVIGNVTFEQAPRGVLISVEVSGLEPGAHGIHLHSVGACAPDFTAAKGHINPDGVAHGLRNPDGPDNGDLPLLHVGADGSAKAEFFTTRVTVTGRKAPALLDDDGSTVVIHAHPDDHMAQPIGGAGGRVGCGVIDRAGV